jgi:hypothetical protein
MLSDPDSLVVIHAASQTEAGFVKGLLDEADIPAFLSDEFMGTIAPWYVTPGGAGPVKVSVFKRDQERAQKLIHDVQAIEYEAEPTEYE